jgi:hypothetical protein
VAEAEELVVGQTADGSLGVVVGDVDPQCGAAGAGVAEVQLDGGGSSVTAPAIRWARLRSA